MLTARAAAAYLDVPVRSIYALPIPRYTLSPRRTRWRTEDLEEYLRSCRSLGTNAIGAGASISTARLEPSEPELAHSLASALASRGASLPEIGAVLGHKSVQATRRYAHLYPQRVAELVSSVRFSRTKTLLSRRGYY